MWGCTQQFNSVPGDPIPDVNSVFASDDHPWPLGEGGKGGVEC